MHSFLHFSIHEVSVSEPERGIMLPLIPLMVGPHVQIARPRLPLSEPIEAAFTIFR